jgi:nickel-dependent lactate racemase
MLLNGVVTVRIDYGREGLDVELPEKHAPTILRAKQPVPLSDPISAIRDSLRNPLGARPLAEQCRAGGLTGDGRGTPHPPPDKLQVGIAFNDVSRATPNDLIIPAIVEELREAGVRTENITLFNATGTHRQSPRQELEEILSPELVCTFRIVQNDCEAPGGHRFVGRTSGGTEVRILEEFLNQDIRIATGFIEPHFFAGFSGGGKAVVPGLAHLDTILHNHRAHHMDHPDATWGKTVGNPLWEDLAEAASFADPVFLVNVAMTGSKEIAAVFAGDREAAHNRGCSFVADHSFAPVDQEFDIVLTSNSGYPLDLNLYQAVKGMSAAGRIVRPGGEIIVAAECWDGLPSHGLFAKLVMEAESPEELLSQLHTKRWAVRDAWQAHIFALLRQKARITLVSSGLGPDDVPEALCSWAPTVEEALEAAAPGGPKAAGERPTLCVLPEGPLTIPTLTAPRKV